MNNTGTMSHLHGLSAPPKKEGTTAGEGEHFPVKPEFERFLDLVSQELTDATSVNNNPFVAANPSSSSRSMPHANLKTDTRSSGYSNDGATPPRSSYTHHHHPAPASLPLPDPSPPPLYYSPPSGPSPNDNHHQWVPPPTNRSLPPQNGNNQWILGPTPTNGTSQPTGSSYVTGRSQPFLLLPPPPPPMIPVESTRPTISLIHYNNGKPPPKVNNNPPWGLPSPPPPLPPPQQQQQQQGSMPPTTRKSEPNTIYTPPAKRTQFIAWRNRNSKPKLSLLPPKHKPDPPCSVNVNPSSRKGTTAPTKKRLEAGQKKKPFCHSIHQTSKHSKPRKPEQKMLTTAQATAVTPTSPTPAAATPSRVVLWDGEDRVIGKIQRFNQGKWGKEVNLKLSDLELNVDNQGNKYWSYRFFLGGSIRFYPQFINQSDSEKIKNYVLDNHMGVLRQYPIRGVMEPRLHGLLDCKPQQQQQPTDYETTVAAAAAATTTTTTTCSYSYHGIKMKAVGHVADLPALEQVSQKAALAAGIGDAWNIGCDVIVYRNLYDKIGWHADDTQEEECIFSVVPHSHLVRPLYFAPKGSDGRRIKKEELKDGYERLKIYPAGGDSYMMDGQLQQFYVHSLPRVSTGRMTEEEIEKCRRIALIFRHGREKRSDETSDKGLVPQTLKGTRPATAEERHPFGPMLEVVKEGRIYSRVHLLKVAAFSCAQGGISGTKQRGCSAIVVSRQSPDCFEADDFSTLLYSSTAAQSAGALFKTYVLQQNYVRVFRSTALDGVYGARNPQATGSKKQKQMYRYDGLYRIADCWVVDTKDQRNRHQPSSFPRGKVLYTFMLKRADVKHNGNQLSTEEHLKHCYQIGTIDPTALWCYFGKTTSSNHVPSETSQQCMHQQSTSKGDLQRSSSEVEADAQAVFDDAFYELVKLNLKGRSDSLVGKSGPSHQGQESATARGVGQGSVQQQHGHRPGCEQQKKQGFGHIDQNAPPNQQQATGIQDYSHPNGCGHPLPSTQQTLTHPVPSAHANLHNYESVTMLNSTTNSHAASCDERRDQQQSTHCTKPVEGHSPTAMNHAAAHTATPPPPVLANSVMAAMHATTTAAVAETPATNAAVASAAVTTTDQAKAAALLVLASFL